MLLRHYLYFVQFLLNFTVLELLQVRLEFPKAICKMCEAEYWMTFLSHKQQHLKLTIYSANYFKTQN